jgi:glutamate synthase domain-containing protein 2
MDFTTITRIIEFSAALFLFVLGLAVLALVTLYILDVTQTKHAVRRNFPVIGRMRYLLEDLGEFLRQYFFAQDREEMPFNRAERSYVYRAAKDLDTTLAFGSTRDLRPTGTILFANAAYPPLDQDAAPTGVLEIGPYARHPYCPQSLFNISGMSYGAISRPAALALSNGARKAGIWLNTGEGGLAPYHLEGGCDIVFQIGTAKYGVRDEHGGLSDEKLRQVVGHPQIKMVEIKLSQGAKPGKGGILPGVKVTAEIAQIRGIPQGKDSISPNRHPEIGSAGDLLDMIAHVRDVTGKPTGFKAVIGGYDWLEDLMVEIGRRGIESAPDFITIDSGDGGTGAAPMSLMDYVGLPIKETLPRVADIIDRAGLHGRTRIIASGKLITPAEATWAICAGADFVQSARGFMFALGCIQALQCNRNTCPTGVTTHDPRLQQGLDPVDKAERVARYAKHMHHEIGIIAHSCGVREPRQLQRHHCRIVCADGRTNGMHELYPPVTAQHLAMTTSPATGSLAADA